MAFENLHKNILRACAEDHCGLWEVVERVSELYKDTSLEFIRATCLKILSDLLDGGYISAGIPTRDGCFDCWDMSVAQTMDRIKREWEQLGRKPSIGDIVWFSATLGGHRKLLEGKETNTLEE